MRRHSPSTPYAPTILTMRIPHLLRALAVSSAFFLTATASAFPRRRDELEVIPSSDALETRALPGTLVVVAQSQPFTFKYTTPDPFSTNWIGIYRASGGGPDNEQMNEPSLVWAYTPDASGTIHLPIDKLTPGEQYKAYFLSRDGYKWLADPVVAKLPVAPVSFPVSSAKLHNARQGDAYTAKLRGLVLGGASVTFTKISGDDWIKVSSDGTLTGTPGAAAKDASVTVEAKSSDSSARLTLSIPVRASGQPLVPEVAIMNWNLWHGGSQVNNYHAKQLRFLLDSKVDIVGLEEAVDGGGHVNRLATALGWYAWQSKRSVGIISRYPIAQVYPELSASGGVRITLDGTSSQLNFWTAHLGSSPYGPYDFCFDKMTVDRVLGERESQSGRTAQITETLNAMAEQLKPANADSVPVLLLGDLNAPSHLDYTPALQSKNCGYANVAWPTSIKPTQAGLVDSFRVVNPDPLKVPGNTWSPLYPNHDGATGKAEPQDRIDFIYHKGKRLSVGSSRTLVAGSPRPVPDHKDNEWTSDHTAVLTVYKVSQ